MSLRVDPVIDGALSGIGCAGEREIFYKVPKSMGGKDEVQNMAYVHKHCQSIFLERRAKA